MKGFIPMLLLLFAIPFVFGQADSTPIATIPPQEVAAGDNVTIKLTLISKAANGTVYPYLNVVVNVVADFFSIQLFDDGNHQDGKVNDGTYANVVTANAPVGTYLLTYAFNAPNSRPIQASLKIIPKPIFTSSIIANIVVILAIVSVIGFSSYKLFMSRQSVKKSVVQLEERKRKIDRLIKKVQYEFYTRVITEGVYKGMMERYKQEKDKIDVELRDLKSQLEKTENQSERRQD